MSCTCLRSARPMVASTSRLSAPSTLSVRSIHAPSTLPAKGRVPEMRGSIQSPTALLSLSARGLDSYASKILPADLPVKEQWAKLFTASSAELADAGMSVQERRYLLWLLEKYRKGADVTKEAHPVTPKKKVRGWGPKIQNGKAIR